MCIIIIIRWQQGFTGVTQSYCWLSLVLKRFYTHVCLAIALEVAVVELEYRMLTCVPAW